MGNRRWQRPRPGGRVRPSGLGWRRVAAASLVVVAGGGLGACTGSSSTAVSESFVASGPATAATLAADAAVLGTRLHAFGVVGVSTFVSNRRVVVRVTGSTFPTIPAGLLATGRVLARPVLCGAPSYTAGSVPPTGPLPTCAAPYRLTAANLRVTMTTGQPAATPAPDPAFGPLASTTASSDRTGSPVLLPVDSGGGVWAPRLVLGAAALSLGPAAAASATYQPGSGEAVDVTFTAAQAKAWDALCRAQFHALVAIDVDATVLSAPLLQPTQPTFTSFNGRVQLAGDLDRTSARVLAAQLVSGPLPVPLRS